MRIEIYHTTIVRTVEASWKKKYYNFHLLFRMRVHVFEHLSFILKEEYKLTVNEKIFPENKQT
jgi:hypothetical protein